MIFFVIITIGWVFSVCLHEFAHAAVAYCGGDRSVAKKGYLTMNPLKYTHPLYSLAMPMLFLALGGIGLPGGAGYINNDMLRSRPWRTAVSLAGPAATCLLMILLALPFMLGVFPPGDSSAQACCLAFLVALQACAMILNLMPIPSLDGFGAISPYLARRTNEKIMRYAHYWLLGFVVALWHLPGLGETLWRVVWKITSVVGIEPHQIQLGWQAFRFWEKP